MSFNSYQVYSTLSSVESEKFLDINELVKNLDLLSTVEGAKEFLKTNYNFEGANKSFLIEGLSVRVDEDKNSYAISFKQENNCYVYSFEK